MSLISKITKQAYDTLVSMLPRGRAFNVPEGSVMDKLFRGIAKSFEKYQEDANFLKEQLSPLTEGFSTEDAKLWEERLWILTKTDNFDFDLRKEIILQRMRYPGKFLGRNSAAYMEFLLKDAGFGDNVRVFANRFSDGAGGIESLSPSFLDVSIFMDDSGSAPEQAFMDDRTEVAGNTSFMGRFGVAGIVQLVLNTIAPDLGDDEIIIPIPNDKLKYTFFISGGNGIEVSDILIIPKDRELEFRLLILTSKPAESLGILNVQYV